MNGRRSYRSALVRRVTSWLLQHPVPARGRPCRRTRTYPLTPSRSTRAPDVASRPAIRGTWVGSNRLVVWGARLRAVSGSSSLLRGHLAYDGIAAPAAGRRNSGRPAVIKPAEGPLRPTPGDGVPVPFPARRSVVPHGPRGLDAVPAIAPSHANCASRRHHEHRSLENGGGSSIRRDCEDRNRPSHHS
jgi:hypothetical protein